MLTEPAAAYWQRARWIEIAFLLLAAPFLLFPTLFLPGTLIALLLTAMIWVLPLLLARAPLPRATPLHVALLLFSLALAVAIFVTADPDLTLGKATNLILGLTLWRTLTLFAGQRRRLAAATGLFLLLGVGIALFGILNADWVAKAPSQVAVLQNVVTQRPWQVIALIGAESGIHPNQVAGAITLFLPLLLSLWLGWRSPRWPRAVWLALGLATLLAGLSLLFTQSRSGWLGGLGGVFVLALLWALVLPAGRARRALGASLVVLALLAGLLLVQLGPQRWLSFWEEPQQATAVGSTATLSYRQAIWPWALMAARDFAYTGTGLGTFRQVAERLYPVAVPADNDFGHAHNVFLQVALDLGLPGLVAYLALLLLAGGVCWQVARRDAALRPFALGYLASFVAFHLYGLTDAVALGAKPGFLFWWLLGLTTALAATGKTDTAVLS